MMNNNLALESLRSDVNEESTTETTRNLTMQTTTHTMMYEEVEGALVSYLETVGRINTDRDFIINVDLGIPLNADGLVEFDIESVPVEQLEFDFNDA